jgi:deoxyadenosine/deoxycytidine kinase
MSEPAVCQTTALTTGGTSAIGKAPDIAGYYRLLEAVTSGAFVAPSSDFLRYSKLRGCVVGTEGLMSAGKTTLGTAIAKFLNDLGIPAEFFQENIDENLLHLFYSNPKAHAFAFQTYMLRSCIANLEKATERARATGKICIIDRCTWGNAVFATLQREEGNISDEEWATYLSILRSGEKYNVDYVIYLDRHPAACHETIAVRGRQSEAAIPLSYLEKLERHYTTNLILHLEKGASNAVVLDWTKFGNAQQALDAILAHTRPYKITGNTLPIFTKDRAYRAKVLAELAHKGQCHFEAQS